VLGILVVGTLTIGFLIFLLVRVLVFVRDAGAPKPLGYRVGRVVGLAIVAVGVVITFLSVRVQYHVSDQDLQDVVTSPVHWTYFVDVACGSVWQAMFTPHDDKCGSAALPRLWIAAGVAAVGMVSPSGARAGVGFWPRFASPLLAHCRSSSSGWSQ
jgi:hypothetical protein